MVEGGFEPPKCETEDLKSSPFDLALVLNQERDKGGRRGREKSILDGKSMDGYRLKVDVRVSKGLRRRTKWGERDPEGDIYGFWKRVICFCDEEMKR